MKYHCTYCEYRTENKVGYHNHCKTIKHNNNKGEVDQRESKIKQEAELIKCDNCEGLFKYDKLQNHIKKCILYSLCEKQNSELVETIKDLNKKLDESDKKLDSANKNYNIEMKE
jgi:hypothetical protein